MISNMYYFTVYSLLVCRKDILYINFVSSNVALIRSFLEGFCVISYHFSCVI